VKRDKIAQRYQYVVPTGHPMVLHVKRDKSQLSLMPSALYAASHLLSFVSGLNADN